MMMVMLSLARDAIKTDRVFDVMLRVDRKDFLVDTTAPVVWNQTHDKPMTNRQAFLLNLTIDGTTLCALHGWMSMSITISVRRSTSFIWMEDHNLCCMCPLGWDCAELFQILKKLFHLITTTTTLYCSRICTQFAWNWLISSKDIG